MTASEESPVLARLQGATHLEDYAHNPVRPSESFDEWQRVDIYSYRWTRETFYIELGDALGLVTAKERAMGHLGHWRWFAELAFEVYDDGE